MLYVFRYLDNRDRESFDLPSVEGKREDRADVSEMGRLFLGRRELRKCVRSSQPASQGLAPENQLLDPYINLMGEARAVASRCAHAFSSLLSSPFPFLILFLSYYPRNTHTHTHTSMYSPECNQRQRHIQRTGFRRHRLRARSSA